MNNKNALASLALITVLIAMPVIAVSVNATCLTTDEYKHGPRSDELLMNFYADVEGAYGALKAGAVDAVWFDITYEQFLDASEDPNIQLVPVDDMGMYEVDINNNYTIATYPGVRSPTHSIDFRRAMAHLFDKDYAVANCCRSFATRIDVSVAAATDVSWINTSVVDKWDGVYYGNYPYPYDPWAAQNLLDAAGFVVGTTPNPAYDPDVPWSQGYLRTYPNDWDGKAGQDLDPLIACIRIDDSRRLCMGRLLSSHLELSGIPINQVTGTLETLYPLFMVEFDYHFYTGGWSVDRFPATYDYILYHSPFWCPSDRFHNYVTGCNKNGQPNYPDLDEALDAAYYCHSIVDSQLALQKAQGLLVDKYCVCIWAFSAKSYWAYRNLLGVVNMDGYGLDNEYTFMKMRTVDGSVPTVGIISPPYQMNVLMSAWIYDRQVLDRCYGHAAGISIAPYSSARDQPWVVQDWTTGVWTDPEDGTNKTVVTVWFRENIKWIAPVDGHVYGIFTADDFKFSEYLIAAYKKSWTHDKKLPIHHIKTIDPYTVQVYMESESFWLQYVGDYVVNKDLWLDKFCMVNTTTVVLNKDYAACEKLWLRSYITSVGPGQGAGQILQMVDCTLDNVTLLEDVDFEIVMLEDDNTYFHWLRPASEGQVLTVTYWTIDPSKPTPNGYWPGDLPWEQIAVGIGTHYLVDYVKGAGGYAALKANRNFWLETPVPDSKGADACSPFPGEVDWIWEWNTTRDTDRPLGGPRCGQYKVDISDMVLCTAAYRSHGSTCPPDDKWFAGADQAPPEGFIDVADVVSVTGRYRRTFGGWSKCLTCP